MRKTKMNPLKPMPQSEIHLDSKQLASRWNMSHRTLDRWRWQGTGPQFIKIGSRVLYRLNDIEEYENTHLCHNTVYQDKIA